MSRVQSPEEARKSSPKTIQTGPEAHPASCHMGTGDTPGGTAATEWHWATLSTHPGPRCLYRML